MRLVRNVRLCVSVPRGGWSPFEMGVSREGESALLEMILAWATRDPLLGTNY